MNVKTIVTGLLLLTAGVALAPEASASCAAGDVPDCARDLIEFADGEGCFNGPVDDRIDHVCWAP